MQQYTRRQTVRLGAVGASTVALGAGAGPDELTPVDDAEAIPPLVAAGVIAGAAVVGWAVREYEVVGSDSPPKGLTPGALKSQSYQTARARRSNNKSTMVDNRNILDGVENAAWADGKIAAIEALNNQASKERVKTAATKAIDEYQTTVIGNILKSWSESVREYHSMISTASDHPDLNPGDVFKISRGSDNEFVFEGNKTDYDTHTTDLPSESGFEVDAVTFKVGEYGDRDSGTTHLESVKMSYSPIDIKHRGNSDVTSLKDKLYAESTSGGVQYLKLREWRNLLIEAREKFDSARDGLALWVDEVYGEIQEGELNTADLLTPREIAELSADEEDTPQAVADLMALNIPSNLDRQVTLKINNSSHTSKLSGKLSPTDPPATGFKSGETYDPNELDGDIFFTYDVSQGSGTWTDYEEGIDGGEITFTSEPYEGVRYRVQTAAGEQVDITASDFSREESGSTEIWTYNATSLNDQITNISNVSLVSQSDETDFTTIKLEKPFTITKIENADGENVDEANYSPPTPPQKDSNYIDEEEWEAFKEQQQELIDTYEDQKGGGGINLGIGSDDLFGTGVSVPGAAVLAGLGYLLYDGFSSD